MPFYLYSRWDGTQQVFELNEEDLMEQLSEQLSNHGDVAQALEAMIQRGLRSRYGQDVPGIDQILQRLQDKRQQLLDRYNLDHILEDIERQLQEIVDTERAGIERRLREARDRLFDAYPKDTTAPSEAELNKMLQHLEQMGRRNLDLLDQLPSDPAGRIEGLRQYDFMDQDARSAFHELLNSFQQQMLDSTVKELALGLGNGTSLQLASLNDMLRDLNQLMEEHLEGSDQPSRAMFDRFMQKYGQLFSSGGPANVEDLADALRRQVAQMEALLHSLPEESRRELENALSAILQDPDLQEEMARLSHNLQRLSPGQEQAAAHDFQGDEQMGLQEALDMMGQLYDLGELDAQLRKAQQGRNTGDVDIALLREYLGEETCQAMEQLKTLAEMLEAAGYIRNSGSRLELTPKGVRKIGHKALQEIFNLIRKDRAGSHRTVEKGSGVDLVEDTHPYQFGEPFNIHLQRTMMNAVQRTPGTPVNLKPEDFEVRQLEQISHASTVLMLDLSLSMATRGNFPAAKKVALALDNLIRTQFPRDSLQIVGFSTYAREVKPEQVAYLAWDQFDPYTNIQHGLSTARKLLARTPGSAKQIIMISDGEPTAHMEGGELFLQYPPSARTIRETLKEVRRCTRQGIKINMFMLDRNSSLVEFVDQMTRINRGRVFYTSPNKLGEYLLVDYLSSRRNLLA